MAVTITTQDFLNANMARVIYTSGLSSPTYYRWIDGIFAESTQQTTWLIPVAPGEVVQVDVFDSSSDSPDDVYPSRLTIQWDGDNNAAMYSIHEYVDEEWVLRGRVPSRGTGRIHTFQSRTVEDGATIVMRVTPYDSADNAGSATTFSALMVRRPDAPSDDTLTYDATTGEIEVT